MTPLRLSRFFVDTPIVAGSRIELPESTAHYLLHVRRFAHNDQVSLFNGCEAMDWLARLIVAKKKVSAEIISKQQNNYCDSPLEIEIVQAIGKSDRMDYLIQKGSELGASHFRLFNSERTQTTVKKDRAHKKLEHWRGVAISACEQCGRQLIPQLDFIDNFENALSKVQNSFRLLLDFEGQPLKQLLAGFKSGQKISILIGPEGGFNQQEINQAKAAGFLSCSLGNRVLRMETVSSVMLSLLQHELGDLSP